MAEGIPDEAVELAARSAFEHDRLADEPAWDDLQPHDADSYRSYARRTLEAAASLIVARAALAERVKIVREIRDYAEKMRRESWTPSAGVALGAIVDSAADMVNTLPEVPRDSG